MSHARKQKLSNCLFRAQYLTMYNLVIYSIFQVDALTCQYAGSLINQSLQLIDKLLTDGVLDSSGLLPLVLDVVSNILDSMALQPGVERKIDDLNVLMDSVTQLLKVHSEIMAHLIDLLINLCIIK